MCVCVCVCVCVHVCARSCNRLYIGVLLRQIGADPLLSQYNVLIIDEVHERHITTDILLGVLRYLLPRRPDLKLVLMSATINEQLFSEAFGGAPILRVPGRTFPIDVEYIPSHNYPATTTVPQQANDDIRSRMSRTKIHPAPYLQVLERIDMGVPPNERGDVLIFVSGMYEINVLYERLKQYGMYTKNWIVLKLHSSLSIDEQDRVFDVAPEGVRKCIISTNIAETAITIDGIRFVVDSGKVKEISYDASARMQSLQEFWCSKASAEQRKGRAGRTGPGVCFRLYSEDEFEALVDYPIPEICRIPLASVILDLYALRLCDPRDFPFLERPEHEAIEAAIKSLKQHQAIVSRTARTGDEPCQVKNCVNRMETIEADANVDCSLPSLDKAPFFFTPGSEQITALGHVISKLPVDIPIAKMLILSTIFGVTEAILTIAAALSVQSPFLRITERNADAITARNRFLSTRGDAFTLMNIFNAWMEQKSSRKNTKRWCRRHALEEQRLYEIVKLRRQFSSILSDYNLISKPNHPGSILSADQVRFRRRIEGELRRLRRLQQAKRKRKVLKFNHSSEDDGECEEEEEGDPGDEGEYIRHLDFLLHTLNHCAHQAAGSDTAHPTSSSSSSGSSTSNPTSGSRLQTRFTQSLNELELINFIVCSSLYPNFAVADELNEHRKESELLYHTSTKEFNLLHPTCSLVGSHSSATSSTDELLCYLKLLETRKPYLMGVTTMNALPVLCLVAETIDTTPDCSRFVLDDWLEVVFNKAGRVRADVVGVEVLSLVSQLRLLLRNLLRLKLASTQNEVLVSYYRDSKSEKETNITNLPEEVPKELRRCALLQNDESFLTSEEKLTTMLVSFLRTRFDVTVTRIRPSELSSLFAWKNESPKETPLDPIEALEAKTAGGADQKEGTLVFDFLRYGSVLQHRLSTSGFSAHIKKKWKCNICQREYLFSASDILQHEYEHEQERLVDEEGPLVGVVRRNLEEARAETKRKKRKSKRQAENEERRAAKEANNDNITTTGKENDEDHRKAEVKETINNNNKSYGRSEEGKETKNDIPFTCEICSSTFLFSPIQILRHKNTCF